MAIGQRKDWRIEENHWNGSSLEQKNFAAKLWKASDRASRRRIKRIIFGPFQIGISSNNIASDGCMVYACTAIHGNNSAYRRNGRKYLPNNGEIIYSCHWPILISQLNIRLNDFKKKPFQFLQSRSCAFKSLKLFE